MLQFDLLLVFGAVVVFAGWLLVSRRARTICRASLAHVGRDCDVCPKTFKITASPK
jgi:hypothetical protein